jgi:hypothetical protein
VSLADRGGARVTGRRIWRAALAPRALESAHVRNQKENTVNKMRRLYRIGAMIGAILLPISVVMATGITEASAATSYQYCAWPGGIGPACLNAWGGGPNVNVEESDNPNIQNNRFVAINEGGGSYQIQFLGGGPKNGDCISDANNDPNNAVAALLPCHDHSGLAPWGSVFNDNTSVCSGLNGFYNTHWRGYLGPPSGFVNGSHFYLNKPSSSPVCFEQIATN